MTLFATIYLVISLGTLATLSAMILKIGQLMGDCPGGSPAAYPAALTIATGYASIGAGGVMLIGQLCRCSGIRRCWRCRWRLASRRYALGWALPRRLPPCARSSPPRSQNSRPPIRRSPKRPCDRPDTAL